MSDDKTPFWKKEISLGRRKAGEEPVAPDEPELEIPEDVFEPEQPVLELVRELDPEPADEGTVSEYGWLTAALASTTEELRDPDPEPAAAVPAPSPGIHPPVPAAELPPLDGEEPKKPLLKREISFRRKPKEPKPPKASKERTAKQPKAPKEPKVKAPKKPKEPKEPRAKRAKGASTRQKRLVGLKIGGSQIAAAVVANDGSAELLQVARTPLEPGIVVGGELRDPDALAEALKAFFRAHKLPRRSVRLGIANNRIGVRSLEMAGIDDPKQLANAIRFRAQEALPIPIEEAVLDYQVLSEGWVEGELTRRVLLVVAYRELVDRYLDACRKAGLRLVGIDLEAFALLRALSAPRPEEDGAPTAALVAVSVGHDRSTFAVSDGRVCEFTRVLEWGGFSLNVAIARALDIAPSEAEPIKRALSLDGAEVPDGLTAEQAELAREAMLKQVHSFARELVSSLQFYQSQAGSLGIATISVTGGTAHLGGLARELERLIGVGVTVGDPLARVRLGKKVGDAGQVGSLAVAIGLGIED